MSLHMYDVQILGSYYLPFSSYDYYKSLYLKNIGASCQFNQATPPCPPANSNPIVHLTNLGQLHSENKKLLLSDCRDPPSQNFP